MNDSRLMASMVGTTALVVLLVVLLFLLRAERRRAKAPDAAVAAPDLTIEPTLEVAQQPEEVNGDDVEVEALADSGEVRRTPRRSRLAAVTKRRTRRATQSPEPVQPSRSDEVIPDGTVIPDATVIRGVNVMDEFEGDEGAQGPEPARGESATTEDAMESMHLLYRSRVDATCRAISRRIVAAEDPETLSARLSAAVDRLDVPVTFARPKLSPARAGTSVSEVAPSTSTVAPIVVAAPIAPTFSTELPFGSYNETHSEARVMGDEVSIDALPPDANGESTHDASVPDEAEVVMPVPPMASDDSEPRRRSWRRGRHD